MFIYSRGFKAILKQDRKNFAGVDIPIIDNDYTGSDLQVLVEEHIEAAMWLSPVAYLPWLQWPLRAFTFSLYFEQYNPFINNYICMDCTK